MRTILIATSNQGKLRDFAAAAESCGVNVVPVPGLAQLAVAREDAPTFEANACKKAQHYSKSIKGEYVLADDSGLEVDALGGAPGVHSARYASIAGKSQSELTTPAGNSSDESNNSLLLKEMADVPDEYRGAHFVCVIAVAREGRLVACFRGEVSGAILREPRGAGGFGYDPLFCIRAAGSTLAELSEEQKAACSHRGEAFRKFLKWYTSLQAEPALLNSAT